MHRTNDQTTFGGGLDCSAELQRTHGLATPTASSHHLRVSGRVLAVDPGDPTDRANGIVIRIMAAERFAALDLLTNTEAQPYFRKEPEH